VARGSASGPPVSYSSSTSAKEETHMRKRVLLIIGLGMTITVLLLFSGPVTSAQPSRHAPGEDPCSVLIGSGSFETGDFSQWTTIGSPLVVDDQKHSASTAGWGVAVTTATMCAIRRCRRSTPSSLVAHIH